MSPQTFFPKNPSKVPLNSLTYPNEVYICIILYYEPLQIYTFSFKNPSKLLNSIWIGFYFEKSVFYFIGFCKN